MDRLLLFWLCLVLLEGAGAASGYTDAFGRNVMWPMYRLSLDSASVSEQRIADCFNNASFTRHITANCDMFHNRTDNAIECAAGSALIHDFHAILLSFRGTVGQPQWDQEFGNLQLKTAFPGGGTVSLFYFNAFRSVWEAGVREDFLAAKNAFPHYQLWITGYSLGGAMATFAATYISQLGYLPSERIRLVTFGEMRIGDSEFAARVPQLVPFVFRVVHNHDSIPHSVTQAEGYRHHRNEIWYPNEMAPGSEFVECDAEESPKCSDGLPPTSYNFTDHGTYFQYKFVCIKGLNLTIF